MRRTRIASVLLSVAAPSLWWGCAATYPLPTQRMADAQSAERSARELGADSKPTAQLNLKLADEQIALAKTAIQRGDNQNADFLLIRAKADAELALALAREQDAVAAARAAADTSIAAANATANANGTK